MARNFLHRVLFGGGIKMNDYQRQARFDRAQASYDNMSPDEGPEPPEGDCPTCGEPSENFDSERDEEGTHAWMTDCESCVNLANFNEDPKECIQMWREAWLEENADTQNPETKRWTRHADARAEINKICDLALLGLEEKP